MAPFTTRSRVRSAATVLTLVMLSGMPLVLGGCFDGPKVASPTGKEVTQQGLVIDYRAEQEARALRDENEKLKREKELAALAAQADKDRDDAAREAAKQEQIALGKAKVELARVQSELELAKLDAQRLTQEKANEVTLTIAQSDADVANARTVGQASVQSVVDAFSVKIAEKKKEWTDADAKTVLEDTNIDRLYETAQAELTAKMQARSAISKLGAKVLSMVPGVQQYTGQDEGGLENMLMTLLGVGAAGATVVVGGRKIIKGRDTSYDQGTEAAKQAQKQADEMYDEGRRVALDSQQSQMNAMMMQMFMAMVAKGMGVSPQPPQGTPPVSPTAATTQGVVS